jgi:polyferredoxin
VNAPRLKLLRSLRSPIERASSAAEPPGSASLRSPIERASSAAEPPGSASLRSPISGRHRYTRLRTATMAISLAVLLAVPLSGLARVDLAGDAHLALGRRVDLLTGCVAVAIAIFGFYIVTFALNAFFGRVFCGWGCPVGEASRLADLDESSRGRGKRLWAYALLLAAAVEPWWIAPLRAPIVALAAWLALATAIVLFGRRWRWAFCRRVCPIGIYYSAVQTRHGFGVCFDARDCTDCGACARICPVQLDPRDLSAKVQGLGGLALDDMPARHHCLTCGDCVRACELVLRKRALPRLPLHLGRAKRETVASRR